MKKNVTLSFDAEVYGIFQALCDKDGLSYSRVIEVLLMYYIEKESEKQREAK